MSLVTSSILLDDFSGICGTYPVHHKSVRVQTVHEAAFGYNGSCLNVDVTKWVPFLVQETGNNDLKYGLDLVLDDLFISFQIECGHYV